jgi:hypothetical protein
MSFTRRTLKHGRPTQRHPYGGNPDHLESGGGGVVDRGGFGTVGYDFEWVGLPAPAAAARDCFEAFLGCDHGVPCHESYDILAEPFRFQDRMRRAAMTYEAEHQPFPEWPFSSEEWRAADPS